MDFGLAILWAGDIRVQVYSELSASLVVFDPRDYTYVMILYLVDLLTHFALNGQHSMLSNETKPITEKSLILFAGQDMSP